MTTRPYRSTSRANTSALPPKPLNWLFLIVILAMLWPLLSGPITPSDTTVQTLASSGIDTIANSTDAIARSTALFPAGYTPGTTVARLITKSSLDTWRNVTSPTDNANAPVWLVGIAGTGLTVDSIAPHGATGDTRSISGVFFAWDANAGYLLGKGALGNSWPQTMTSISNLSNQSLTIVTATARPTQTPYPTDNPAATPTSHPDGD